MNSAEEDARRFLKQVIDFKQRTFTGAEVLEICDYLGAGVGATIAAVDAVKRAKKAHVGAGT